MNRTDYIEWCDLAGLYVKNVSHADRYRTYSEKISLSGLNVVVVSDFLDDNSSVIDLQNWRSYSIYEMGDEGKARIELTARALEAIGAPRVAAKIRITKSNSPMDMLMKLGGGNAEGFDLGEMLSGFRENVAKAFPEIAGHTSNKAEPAASIDAEIEPREQIEHLLEQYVAKQAAELQADIEKYGDPRTAPGFTLAGRQAELERLGQQYYSRERQLREVDDLRMYLQTFERRMADGVRPEKLAKLRRMLLDGVEESRRTSEGDMIPELREVLDEANRFIDAHPDLFRPKPINDKKLLKRLAAFGDYRVDSQDDLVDLTWAKPQGLDCSWTTFSLQITFPKRQAKSLGSVLEVADRMVKRFPQQCDQWCEGVLEHFRQREGQLDDWELEDYELDEDDAATNESILKHAGDGTIRLQAYDEADSDIDTSVYFSVEWDEEHGLEIEWEDEPIEAEEPNDVAFLLGKVAISDAGPALNDGDIGRFEKQYGLQLPEDYRQFLQLHNGGKPEPGHLALKGQGVTTPIDIQRFYSVLGSDTAAGSLEAAVASAQRYGSPLPFLPIARAGMPGPAGADIESELILVLAGKKKGQVALLYPQMFGMSALEPMSAAVMPQFGEMLLSSSPKVAKSFGDLFSRLKARPTKKLPNWLALIQQDDTAGFSAWLKAGGKLSETFSDYGDYRLMSVIEYLMRDASIEMLRELIRLKVVKPKQLCASWERFEPWNIARFAELIQLLPKELWSRAFVSSAVWSDSTMLAKLAEARVDVNASVNDEGMPPIHLAVQCGSKGGVRWLIEHGADVHKQDRYRRDAFIWAENGPGFECLPLLQGRNEEQAPTGNASPDAWGIAALSQAAAELPDGHGLMVSIQIKSPPVTRIEKAYYNETCHYRLSIDVRGDKVTFNDMNSARQDYLYAAGWPTFLFSPILQWPELTPLWETIEVRDFDWSKAMKKRNYEGELCKELVDAARSALEQAFGAEEAAARGIRLRK
ncbi:MAG TPA: SMI1/KNR4 family protein [Pirellulaceae bacterium]|nr:SMI1/KNR4 family protein [Pirellulaceae bacterium]